MISMEAYVPIELSARADWTNWSEQYNVNQNTVHGKDFFVFFYVWHWSTNFDFISFV